MHRLWDPVSGKELDNFDTVPHLEQSVEQSIDEDNSGPEVRLSAITNFAPCPFL